MRRLTLFNTILFLFITVRVAAVWCQHYFLFVSLLLVVCIIISYYCHQCLVWVVLIVVVVIANSVQLQQQQLFLPIEWAARSHLLSVTVSERSAATATVKVTRATAATRILHNKQLRVFLPRKQRDSVQVGMSCDLLLKVLPKQGMANFTLLNDEVTLLSQNIAAMARLQKVIACQPSAEHDFLSRWRQSIADTVTQAVSEPRLQALLLALTVGDKTQLHTEIQQLLQQTGTSHLLVISGLHIGFVALLIMRMVLFLGRWVPVESVQNGYWSKCAASCALLAAAVYTALAGAALPAVRALLMLTLLLLGKIFTWPSYPLTLLLLTAALMLILVPSSAAAPSFYLSFFAVWMLLYLGSGRWQVQQGVLAAVGVQAAMSLAIIPLSLLMFGQFSLLAPLANFLAVPMITLVVVPLLLFAALLLPCLPLLALLLIKIAALPLQGLCLYLDMLLSTGAAVYHYATSRASALLFVLLACLAALIPKGFPARAIAVLLLALLFPHSQTLPTGSQLRVRFFDVGQGSAILVQTIQHALLFDSGTAFASKRVVLPELQRLGISLDKIIISHDDSDHSGGIASLTAAYPTAEVISSTELAASSVDTLCRAAQRWQWEGVDFLFLHPSEERAYLGKNNNSCVLQIHSQQGKFLLSGDIEKQAEKQLVDTYGADLRSEVLLVAHHGSKTSSSWSFLSAVQPEYAVISSAFNNPYGFPHQAVLSRYQQLGVQLYNTAANGAIEFLVFTHKPLSAPITAREVNRYWWSSDAELLANWIAKLRK